MLYLIVIFERGILIIGEIDMYLHLGGMEYRSWIIEFFGGYWR